MKSTFTEIWQYREDFRQEYIKKKLLNNPKYFKK